MSISPRIRDEVSARMLVLAQGVLHEKNAPTLTTHDVPKSFSSRRLRCSQLAGQLLSLSPVGVGFSLN